MTATTEERPLLSELSSWMAEQDERGREHAAEAPWDGVTGGEQVAAYEVATAGFVFDLIKRAPTSVEAAAAITGLTREQLETIVLAAAFEWKQDNDPQAFWKWGGVPARPWGPG